ncbi:CerR family C-terminal domain-containing protein [Paraburkholderia sp. J12]|uniref:CerR family C-terminal domain-containing protein n=1 Tax=Paraburkholderia sp. J12 TaxID=2805432 RepID=UPI002ABDCBCB|nr:CerR family C-terminal domain-containing protein [Paraburkholderia sp. J12]
MKAMIDSTTSYSGGKAPSSPKGQQVRERILAAALAAFGEKGFLATTTREISLAAQVTLPALQYYFGNKEGLYRACSEMVTEAYRGHMSELGTAAREALASNAPAREIRQHLFVLTAALAEFLIDSNQANNWALFVAREMSDPGGAFDILFKRLWQPGLLLTADLVARVRGQESRSVDSIIEALMLVSGLMVFRSGRALTSRMFDGELSDEEVLQKVKATLKRQITAMKPPKE